MHIVGQAFPPANPVVRVQAGEHRVLQATGILRNFRATPRLS
jgi:hypothetical protein